jgi:uncharacterized protein
MLGARGCCYILALGLGGACTVTMQPIQATDASGSGGAGKGGTTGTGGADASLSSDVAGKCTGRSGVDADPGGGLAQGLVAYYPCEQASGTALPDQSGNNRNATLASLGTGGSAGYRFAAGKVGKALYLSNTSAAHVVLPAAMLANDCEATVATWVYLNSQSTWQRVWTFSIDNSVYMYLTTNSETTGFVRTGITLDGNGANQQYVEGPATLPTGVWTHVATVLGPAGLVFYVNGAPVAVSTSAPLRPADMGKTLHDYIGRSNYPWDPYLDGNIDEFRVYNRALSAAEVQALAAGS